MFNLISRYKTCKSKIINNNNIKSGNKNEILKKEKKNAFMH